MGEQEQLRQAFESTLAPNPELIKQAEAFLKDAARQPGYGILVLKLILMDGVAVEVRQAAAVNFKNLVKYHWAPREADGLGDAPFAIPDGEKDQIRAHITDLMLSAPPRVRAQLSEALSIISSHDFPARWPTLLPHLIEKMKSQDQQLVNGVLTTADSIYQRYRGQFMTDQLSEELQYSQALVAPLLACLQALSKHVAELAPTAAAAGASGPAVDQLRLVMSNVQLVASIFYSLNSPGLTDAFEETLDAWMAEFHTYMTFEAPALAESDADRESVVDGVKAGVCECLILFMERNEEEFAKFLQTFTQDVWTQLLKVSQAPGQDNLAMHAINFLTAVSKSVHYKLFEGADTLRQICESIVIPNLRMRDDMEEMFEMNWIEYVRRDTEGSDSDTRRRAASELVKSLTDRFPQQVTELFSGYVGAMLAEHARSPAANWKAKDCALYLVTALAVRGKTAATGATTTNALVNLQDFFSQQVVPELAAANVNEQPILKADALKFVTTFRSQLPKETELGLFPALINLLGSESNVVHSYAAIAIDRFLSMREPSAAAAGGQRFQPSELAPLLQPLLEKLFAAFKFPESGENEYLMRAVMRVIAFVGKSIAPVAPACLQQLSQQLLEVCKNPTQPGFNHYLFESVAALVRYGCEADPGAVTQFEAQLFPPFQVVLSEDVQEFAPYVFQIFAQLLEVRPPGTPVPDAYHAIFLPLLTPVFWERSGNVPALVRLLQAYLERAAGDVVSRGYLQPVLGVFQKLIASKAHDHEGFYILGTLVQYLDYQTTMAQYMPTIWGLLFSRLQSSRTAKFTRGLLLFLALFVCKQGAQLVADSIDGVQPGLTLMILQSVWLPTMPGITGAHEEKLVAVATARLISETKQLADPSAGELVGKLLAAEMSQLEGASASSGGEDGGEEGGGVGEEEFAGYSAAYARLHNARRPDRDPLPEVTDARAVLAQALGKMAAAQPGRVPQLVAAALSPEQQQKLAAYCSAAGVAIA